jgi:hypothetical protein
VVYRVQHRINLRDKQSSVPHCGIEQAAGFAPACFSFTPLELLKKQPIVDK